MDVRRIANRALNLTASSRPTEAALELSHVSKRYGAVVALDDVGLIVRPGTVHAVLGENGAGKTTLMHVAYGLVRPDDGHITLDGRVRVVDSPLAAITAGIGMVHQHFTLVPTMTVWENMALGGHGMLRTADLTARVRTASERLGFRLAPSALVESLPVGAQQRVEIAKALVHDASVLILDEPTAVLAPGEVEDLLRWLRQYVDGGHSAILITHKLREALAVADDVTVLRRGRVVFTGRAGEASRELLTRAMIGEAGDDTRPSEGTAGATGDPASRVFDAERIAIIDSGGRTRVRDATFTVNGGELVGVAAVEGAGQRDLLRALAGRRPISAGTLIGPPRVGFVPEDRHADALLLDRSLAENVALRGAGSRRGRVSWSAMRICTSDLMREFEVRASDPNASVRSLSGGNQQRLVLARELSSLPNEPAPQGLVVENATRGLDVRATADVHRRLRAACLRGAAVIMYSSDLDEVLGLASRVLVLFEGILRDVPLDRDTIGRAMLGTS